jgi:hypothetical protein
LGVFWVKISHIFHRYIKKNTLNMKRFLKDFNQFLNEADYDFEVLQSQIDKPILPIIKVIDDLGIDRHCETKGQTWDILIQEQTIPARDFMQILEAIKKAGGRNVTVSAARNTDDPYYRGQAWVQKYAFIIETGIRRSPDYVDPTGSAYKSPAEFDEILRKAKEDPRYIAATAAWKNNK